MKKIFFSFVVVIGSLFFYFNKENQIQNEADDLAHEGLKEQYSTKKIVEEAKSSLINNSIKDLIPNSKPLKINSLPKAKIIFKDQRLNYYSSFNQNQESIYKNLDKIKAEHKLMLDFAYQNDIRIPTLDYQSPELIIYLSIYLDKAPTDFKYQDLSRINLTQENWKYIKRFLDSKKFKSLLSKNMLTQEFVNPIALKKEFITKDDIERDLILDKLNNQRSVASEFISLQDDFDHND